MSRIQVCLRFRFVNISIIQAETAYSNTLRLGLQYTEHYYQLYMIQTEAALLTNRACMAKTGTSARARARYLPVSCPELYARATVPRKPPRLDSIFNGCHVPWRLAT